MTKYFLKSDKIALKTFKVKLQEGMGSNYLGGMVLDKYLETVLLNFLYKMV